MKDFLENLEIGENKIKLSKEEIKEILAKNGEYIKIETDKVENKYKEQLENDKTTIDNLKEQLEKSPKTEDLEKLKETIADYETKEQERVEKQKKEEEEKMLEDSINSLFEGKNFTSDYARRGLLSDIKEGLNKPENKGKGVKDLFEELTKDKTDIFTFDNAEQHDMEGMGDSEQVTIKEMPTLW